MNSQVIKIVTENGSNSPIEHISASALNETFLVKGDGYYHLSSQPSLATTEEQLILDRYIYDDKGEKIAQKVTDVATVTHNFMPNKIEIPTVLRYGTTNLPESPELLSYWVDAEVEGVNAKYGKSILSIEAYKTIIDWITVVQQELEPERASLNTDYAERIAAFSTLFENGYYDGSVNRRDSRILAKTIDYITQSNSILLNQKSVFKHGDLHIANILKTGKNSLAIIDFEASFGGPGDNMKDIMKLLHLDYTFFDVQRSKEGAYLTDQDRVLLLDYYISSSKLDEVSKLREPNYLLKRIAINSLTQYIARLTLATRQGCEYTDGRVQQIVRNMASIVSEMKT